MKNDDLLCNYSVASPLTGGETVPIKVFDVIEITKKWAKDFKYDVFSLFGGVKQLTLRKCLDTGYQFYHPKIEGDSAFYAELQKYPWYY